MRPANYYFRRSSLDDHAGYNLEEFADHSTRIRYCDRTVVLHLEYQLEAEEMQQSPRDSSNAVHTDVRDAT